MIRLALFIFFVGFSAQARTVDCLRNGMWGTPSETEQQVEQLKLNLEKAKEKIEESPFAYACRDPESIKGRPETGLTKRSVPWSDKKGNRSVDFLEKVLDSVEEKVYRNNLMISRLDTCLNKKSDASCSNVDRFVNEHIPVLASEARKHLALAADPISKTTICDEPTKTINRELKSHFYFKEKDWKPLSYQEFDQAQKTRTEEFKKIDAANPNDPKTANQDKLGFQAQHLLEYHAIMSSSPILQKITSSNPSRQEVATAAKEMKVTSDNEVNEVKKMRTLIAEAKKSGKISPDLLKLTYYQTQYEETLLQYPEYCGLGTSLTYTRDNRELGTMLTVAGATLAVSLVSVPLTGGASLGLAVGAVSAIGFAANSHNNFAKERDRLSSQINTESHLLGRKEALINDYGEEVGNLAYQGEVDFNKNMTQMEFKTRDQLNLQRKIDFALAPVGLGIGAGLSKIGKKFIAPMSMRTRDALIATEKLQKLD